MSLLVLDIRAAGNWSLRSIRFPADRLADLLWANGVGKPDLDRGPQLIDAAAGWNRRSGRQRGGQYAGPDHARGGSRTHAGRERAYEYEVSVGLGPSRKPDPDKDQHAPARAAVNFELPIKEATLAFQHARRSVILLQRRGPHAVAREEFSEPADIETEMRASGTALGSLQDPRAFPGLELIRKSMLDWRLHHKIGADGSNLAAVFTTSVHVREDTVDL